MSNPPLSQRLWDDNRDLAEACLEHPFIVGLADGTLSESRYGLFAQQDHFYLDAYARSYAWGAVRAQDFATRRQFGSLLAGIMTEGTLHEKTAPELGVSLEDVQPLPAAREYTDFLLATASLGTIGEHLAAMAPLRQALWMARHSARRSALRGTLCLLDQHVRRCPDYLEKVDIIMGMLDEHGDDSVDGGDQVPHSDGAGVPASSTRPG